MGKKIKSVLICVLLSFSFAGIAFPASARQSGNKPKSIEIIRDNFGVPHIYAKDTHGLFYGYGYSIATDRLFQMEMSKRTVLGTVSEVLGPPFLAYDKGIRSNYSPDLVRKQYEALSDKNKQIFEGYADGINARIDEVMANSDTLLPKQFTNYEFLPTKWTPFDVVMIFVGTMANRFSDFNTEIDNLAFLEYLEGVYDPNTAWDIFNQVKWINDHGAPTTVPKNDELLSATRRSDRSKVAGLKRGIAAKAVAAEKRFASLDAKLSVAAGLPVLSRTSLTSNFWSVGKKKTVDQGAILLNGPQFGWFNPSYVYEVGLHGAGFDVIGNSPFGYPAILFGHNKHIAWGSTAGLGDDVDIFQETLNPENQHQYLFNGKWLDMENRTETIYVKDQEPVTINVYRTVHGIVVEFHPENSLAYSKKRSWEGFEVESLMGWIESTQAENFQQWRRAAAKNALTINWYYADISGNIGYIHDGKYPIRNPAVDSRFPTPGTGDKEWLGLLPFDQNPQVYNPDQGYIANWNNKPADYWNDPDMWYLTWGSADRVRPIFAELTAREKFTKDQIWDINKRISFIDLNIAYFLPFLEKAVGDLSVDSPEAMAVALLKEWNQYRYDMDGDGYYDSPAQTIFQKWLSLMLNNTLADDLGSYFGRYAGTGYPTSPPTGSTNIQTGTKILYHSLLGNASTIPNHYDFFNSVDPSVVVLGTLTEALKSLATEYATENVREWLLPVVQQKFFITNFNGVPQANPDEALYLPINMNRGTENHLVVLKPTGVSGYDVCPPGQSGFVSPDGIKDQHYEDQMDLYKNFQTKPMLFEQRDVTENAESSQILLH